MRPRRHDLAALRQQVRPLIRPVGLRAAVVRGAELDDIAREAGCLRAPVFEAGAETMRGVAVAGDRPRIGELVEVLNWRSPQLLGPKRTCRLARSCASSEFETGSRAGGRQTRKEKNF